MSFLAIVLLKLTSKSPISSLRRRWHQYKVSLVAEIGDNSTIALEGQIVAPRLRQDAVRIGENSFVCGRLITHPNGGRITIGDWCYVGQRTEIWSMASVEIGNRVLISHGVHIIDTTSHSLVADERHEHFRRIRTTGHPECWSDLPGVRADPIVIEDDVWISFNVTILKGVTIGAGSVIGAGVTVVDDVPAGSVVTARPQLSIRPII